ATVGRPAVPWGAAPNTRALALTIRRYSMTSITGQIALTPYQGKLEFDRQVKVRMEELVMEGGFSMEDADGNDVPDWDAFKAEGAVILTGHRVDSPDDR